MRRLTRLSREAGLRVANVFHAGDGNLHPLVLYDRRISGQEEAPNAVFAVSSRRAMHNSGYRSKEFGGFSWPEIRRS